MINTLVLDNVLGPNTLVFSHDPYYQEIFVESDHELTVPNMRRVEEECGLETSLGHRSNIRSSRSDGGKWMTSWNYIESCDCDWT